MKNRVITQLFIICCLVLNVLVNAAVADDKKQSSKPAQSKSEAAQQAQQKVNGRVLKVEQKPDVYRVKVLQKSGRVVSVDVDKKAAKQTKEKKD